MPLNTYLEKLQSSKVIFTHDLLVIPISWIGAYWLRFNLGSIPDYALDAALNVLFIVVFAQAIIFRIFGLYRGVWRFASIPDFIRIVKAIISGVLVISILLFFYDRLTSIPRSVLPLYAVSLLIFLCTPRLFYRCLKDNWQGRSMGKRAIIVGAGMAGEALVRDLMRELDSSFYPVAFVDDDKRKNRREIHGLRVQGSCRKIPRLVLKLQIEVVLIAIPSADDTEMRRIVGFCDNAGVPCLTLPSIREILSGRVSEQELRHVSIEDLLGRDPVRLNWKDIRQQLEESTVLVTGGGGSIGSELCKQLAKLPLKSLVIFEKSEFSLYQIESALTHQSSNLKLHAILGDVSDRHCVNHALSRFRPNVIFHAAAYKHVPLLEYQVCEAIRNNILGTHNVAEAAIEFGVGKFVLISTDKAVNPSSIMGATKRAAEVVCHSMQYRSATSFIAVRFGNVLDSAGSVVPLFRQQIKSGGPVTVTHPDITRYFMTIPEACQLILQSAAVGNGGEVFVLEMGKPIKISYLAEQMIRLSGKKLDQDIEISYTGLRPGEKMHEELFHEQEKLKPTGHNKLLLAKSRFLKSSLVQRNIEEIQHACSSYDENRLTELLIRIVPEYKSPDVGKDNVVYVDSLSKSPATQGL